MTFTIDKPSYSNIFAAVPQAVEAIKSLSIDDQRGLLWVLYENLGSLVIPATPDATERIKIAGGLIYEGEDLPIPFLSTTEASN